MQNTTRLEGEWLNAQYNNRARVANYAEYLEQWASRSQAARNSIACHLDLPYLDRATRHATVPTGVPEPTLDVFPAAHLDAPVLLFIHGGWWRALDKRDNSFVAPPFVAAGAHVVVPNYSLCPTVGMDTIALQLAHALAWTHRYFSQRASKPPRIVVAGHSAGGHLAAMLLCCNGKLLGADLPADLATSALSISGVFDLDPLRRTPFLKADLKLTPRLVRRLSPALFPAPAGRLVTVYGALESEEFARQSSLIQSRWGRRCVPVCEAVAGTNHFTVLNEAVNPNTRLHQQAVDLLMD